jgi:prepilin-type N-terminal cleavage/methylation domain-containing protein
VNNSFADRKYPFSRWQGGFTFIEVMFSVLIITISVLALYEMIVQGNTMLTFQRHKRLALEKAQEHLELMQYWSSQTDTVPRRFEGAYEEVLVPGDPNDATVKDIKANYKITITYSSQVDKRGKPYYSDVSINYKWKEPLTEKDEELALRARY